MSNPSHFSVFLVPNLTSSGAPWFKLYKEEGILQDLAWEPLGQGTSRTGQSLLSSKMCSAVVRGRGGSLGGHQMERLDGN